MTSGQSAVDDDPLSMREGESLEAYVARLESLDRTALDADGLLALVISLAVASKKLNRAARAGAFGLDRCKEAIRKLPEAERELLTRWIGKGMHD
jgi:hypothetical protein